MTYKSDDSWKEEFDKEFVILDSDIDGYLYTSTDIGKLRTRATSENLKSFIRRLRSQDKLADREEERKRVFDLIKRIQKKYCDGPAFALRDQIFEDLLYILDYQESPIEDKTK